MLPDPKILPDSSGGRGTPQLAMVLAGEYHPVQMTSAVWAGCRRLSTLSDDELDALPAKALVLWDGVVPGKVGRYWQPNPHSADGIRRAMKAHDVKSVRRKHTGLGASSTAEYRAVYGEIDSIPVAEQAAAWDEFFATTGLAPALVVHSGDIRPSTIEARGVYAGHVTPGKSLHVFFGIVPAEKCTASIKLHRRVMAMLCTAVGGDPAIIENSAQLMRYPDAIGEHVPAFDRVTKTWEPQRDDIRIQSVLWCPPDPPLYKLSDLERVLTDYLRAHRQVTNIDHALAETKRGKKGKAAKPVEAGGLEILGPDGQPLYVASRDGDAGELTAETEVRLLDGSVATLEAIGRTLDPGGATTQCYCPTHANERTVAAAVGKTQGGAVFVKCFAMCGTSYMARPDVLAGVESVELDNIETELPTLDVPEQPTTRFLSLDLATILAPIVILRASLGAGKSWWAAQQIARVDTAVELVHRQALSRDHARRTGMADYQQIQGAISTHDHPKFVLCVNSINRLATYPVFPGSSEINIEGEERIPSILLIEESESLSSHLYGGTFDEACARTRRANRGAAPTTAVASWAVRPSTWSATRATEVIANGGRVVLVDTHAGAVTQALAEIIAKRAGITRPGGAIYTHEHHVQVIMVLVFAELADMWSYITRDIVQGRRIAIACTSAEDARAAEYQARCSFATTERIPLSFATTATSELRPARHCATCCRVGHP
ncbi:MAG: hypothetical protein U1F43_26325 [Myxococcota bacterium]